MLALLLIFFTVFIPKVLLTAEIVGVRHLVGEPDYRAVRLQWEAYSRRDVGRSFPNFQVRYCELQSWGTQRCRIHEVTEPDDGANEVHQLSDIDDDFAKIYSTKVEGLRMATTYSFEIKPTSLRRENRAEDASLSDNVIVIPTKGFSARATQCLPHASEIEVSTGPHFAGRITVEASGDHCTVDGEPDSQRDTYVLHIDHKLCGSQVNETTVATYVIVQENLPILTHSTRRFLVLCSYQPETLTVRAGISLPAAHAHHHGHGHGYSAPLQPDQAVNSVRRSRQLRPVKMEALAQEAHDNNDNVTPIALFAVMTIIGICGIIVVTFHWRQKSIFRSNIDTESMTSDLCSIADNDNILSSHPNSSSQPNSIYNSVDEQTKHRTETAIC